MTLDEKIGAFLLAGPFAVAGASNDREKYGNIVLRRLAAAGKRPYPINPNEKEIEGLRCYPDLASLPERVRSLSIVTPPEVTERIVAEAIAARVEHVWIQPGAESRAAVGAAEQAGLNVIAGGPCVLVALAAARG